MKQVVEEYMDKFPLTPNLTLAKKIYKENTVLFKSVESVRQMIRERKGQHGKKSHSAKDKSRFQEKGENAIKLGIGNPYGLPESDETVLEPFVLAKSFRKALVLSDIHLPYHSVSALNLAFDYAKGEKPDVIILNGDYVDAYHLSRFEKDPRKRSFKGELDAARKFLSVLHKTFDVPIIMKAGNHDERYEAFLRVKAPELLDIEEFRLDVLMRFREYGAIFVGDKRIIKAGKLNIIHGHEGQNGVFSPVNPARGFYTKFKANVLGGHHHQVSEHSEKDLEGNVITCWSTGCLCELQPAYSPFNKWSHGFAMVAIDGRTGEFEVDNLRIIKGKIR